MQKKRNANVREEEILGNYKADCRSIEIMLTKTTLTTTVVASLESWYYSLQSNNQLLNEHDVLHGLLQNEASTCSITIVRKKIKHNDINMFFMPSHENAIFYRSKQPLARLSSKTTHRFAKVIQNTKVVHFRK